jgi:hypothetical protein
VFYGFTVRLVGAPFFFGRKKNLWELPQAAIF